MKEAKLTALQRVVLGELSAVFFRRRDDHIVIYNHAPQPWAELQLLVIPTDITLLEGLALRAQRKWLLGLAEDFGWELLDHAPGVLDVPADQLGFKLMMNEGRAAGMLDRLPHVHVYLGRGEIYLNQVGKTVVMPMDERHRRAAPWLKVLAA